MPTYTFNEEPYHEEHVCWYTKDRGFDVELMEIVRALYKHPTEPEYVCVYMLEERSHGTHKRASRKGAICVLMEASQKSIHEIAKSAPIPCYYSRQMAWKRLAERG